MAKEFQRTDRVADQIQRELAYLIQHKLKDPRMRQMVTIAAVKVTRDLSSAKVYVTVFDQRLEKPEIEETIKILNHAKGFFRTALSQRLATRTVPALNFIYDKVGVDANRLAQLIDHALENATSPLDDDPSE